MSDLADIRKYGSVIDNGSPTVMANDISQAVNAAIASGKAVYIPPGCYYLAQPIVIQRPTKIIIGDGPSWGSELTWRLNNVYRDDRTIIYSDQNINVFEIESNSVHIRGGCFDFSKAVNHNKAVFYYRLWHTDITQPSTGANVRESNGAYDGSAIDWWIVGNKDTLAQPGNGTRCIHLDWENSPSYSYAYFHKWQGRADRVHSGFSETKRNLNGKIGQNSAWNECELKIWGAKQALIVNTQSRSKFELKFQPSYGLHETEQELPIVEANTSSNFFDCQFVDLSLSPHSVWGYSNKRTIKSVSGNYFEKPTQFEANLIDAQSIETGQAIHPQPAGVVHQQRLPKQYFFGELHNQLVGFDKRGTFAAIAYRKPAEASLAELTTDSNSALIPIVNTIAIAQQATLFRQHGFCSSVDFSALADSSDYLEMVFDWSAFAMQRLQLFVLLLNGPNTVSTGIKQFQVIQIDGSGSVILNKTFDLPATIGAFVSTRDLQCRLNSSLYTKRMIVRLIGSYSLNTSYPIQDIAVYDDRKTQPTYLPITGGHVCGSVSMDGLKVKNGSTYRTIQPIAAGTPTTIQELTDKLKQSGILF